MGQVHYASGDNNPRAAYEGLYAGNPLFVSTSSRLPSRVYEQRFVVGLPFGAPQTEFDGAFEEFMTLVRSNRTQHEVHYWVEKNLQPASIYTEVCRQIGICQQ